MDNNNNSNNSSDDEYYKSMYGTSDNTPSESTTSQPGLSLSKPETTDSNTESASGQTSDYHYGSAYGNNLNSGSMYGSNMNGSPVDKNGNPLKNRFAMKLVFSILEILCCNLISLVCGIIGCVNTAKANTAYKQSRWDDFKSAAKASAISLWIGFGAFVLGIILNIVLLVVMSSAIFSYVNSLGLSSTQVTNWKEFVEWCELYNNATDYTSSSTTDDDYWDYDYSDDYSDSSDTYDSNYDQSVTTTNPDASYFKDSSFALNGTDYVLPCDFSKFEDAGLHMEDEDNTYVLASNDYYVGYLYDGDDNYIGLLYFWNNTDADANMEDCTVIGLSLYDNFYSETTEFSFNGKLDFESTTDDAIALLGDAAETYTDDSSNTEMLTWYGEYYDSNYTDCLSLSFEDGKLSNIYMQYTGEEEYSAD